MILTPLTFQSKGFTIDYISFNIQGSRQFQSICNYFYGVGFNSILKQTFQGESKHIIYDIDNDYQVFFIPSSEQFQNFWTGITVVFAGQSAQQFYQLLQTKEIDLGVFDLQRTNLGRIDIHYFRPHQSFSQPQRVKKDRRRLTPLNLRNIEAFFKDCCDTARFRGARAIRRLDGEHQL